MQPAQDTTQDTTQDQERSAGRASVRIAVARATAVQTDVSDLADQWISGSRLGSVEDAADRTVEGRVELVVALLRREALRQRPREAGDHAGIAGQDRVGIVSAVAAGQRDDTDDLRVVDEIGVETILRRQ